VPADPAGWSVDPFAADVIDDFVYGRGAVDMLNVTAAMAVAIKPYISGEKTPAGDLIFCALADEEAGGRLGALPLVGERWDLVGADYLLTEVAYPGLPGHDTRTVPVTVGEKGAFWSTLAAAGTPGHGSAPYGRNNAIAKLVEGLWGIFQAPSPAAIGEEFAVFAPSLGLAPAILERLMDVETVDAAIDEIAVLDPALARYIHAATHLTVSPNIISGGSKANMIPAHAEADIDIRALPGMDRNLVDAHMRKAMGRAVDDIEIVPFMDSAATSSRIGNKLWDAIAEGVQDIEGHRNLVPTMTTVATDARFWRDKGTVAYGVGLFDERMSFSEMLNLFHGHDERVSMDSVDRTTQLYERVLDRFTSPV
jgi:acetylornithine deacetylase/succinyl-diaminopimelate desuccinylase-like protein